MANIAIITASTSDYSCIRLLDLLIQNGHSCTAYDQYTNVSLNGFDLIITTRVDGGVGYLTNVVLAHNSGVPVICGFDRNSGSGLGDSSNFLAGRLGIASSMITEDNTYSSSIQSISDLLENHPNSLIVNVHNSNDYQSYLPNTDLCPNAIKLFAYTLLFQTHSSVVVCKRGEDSLLGKKFPASCAYVGFLYASNHEYTSHAKSLIIDLVDKVLSFNASAKLEGYSLDNNGNPVVVEVLLYLQSSGSLVDKVTTDQNGKYSLDVLKDQAYFVVCRSPDEEKNYQINAYVVGVEDED